MRFDDSLKTVLAADISTGFGARAAYRQLVDLISRGRAPDSEDLLARLRALGAHVPLDVRVACARGLALADPPVELVALLAKDSADVAAAVLTAVRLEPEAWDALLPRIGPLGRSVLRRRRDLSPSVVRALESFGSADFALHYDGPSKPIASPPAVTPAADEADAAASSGERFAVADLVERLESFQRERETAAATRRAGVADRVVAFRFETDARGILRWVDTGPRGAVIGLSLNHDRGDGAEVNVDGVAAGAFRKRAAFSDARLLVPGESQLGGDWRISAVPIFDQGTGSFVGFRGRARRPRAEESAAPARATRDLPDAEGLRRLVHELRTPTNAIAGFSELIEQELLGPVAPTYRERAATIRRQVGGLIDAIEDLDLAARLEGQSLRLQPGVVPVTPLLARVAEDLAPLARLRGAGLTLPPRNDTMAWSVDGPTAERLVSRLLATLLSAAQDGEMLDLRLIPDGKLLTLGVARPQAFAGKNEATLLALDDEAAAGDEGAPLLGVGFALRLVRNLAIQLGGRIVFSAERLTLRLAAVSGDDSEQAANQRQ